MTKTKKRRGGSLPRYDWTPIRKDYVEGWVNGGEGRHMPTLQELCDKYGCHKGTIFNRCASEKWSDERDLFHRKVVAIQQHKSANELALYGAGVKRRILSVAEQIIVQTARHFPRYEPSDVGPPPLADPLVLQRLSATLKTAAEVALAAIGENAGVEFDDLVRDVRKRIPMYFIAKPPPDNKDDDDQTAD